MEPEEGGERTTGRFETFDANERFVVVRDDDGYGVWRLDDLEEGEPIERFTDDDDGYEAAVSQWKDLTRADRRVRAPWLDRIRPAILVGLAMWAITSATPAILSLFEGRSDFFPGDPGAGPFNRTLYVLNAISFDVWIAGTVAYVILWMDSRRLA